jgi:hypothetical protein
MRPSTAPLKRKVDLSKRASSSNSNISNHHHTLLEETSSSVRPTTPIIPTQIALDPTNIYSHAVRISSPRLVDEKFDLQEYGLTPTFRTKVVRQVEVPFVRQVKVPVVTSYIDPTVPPKRMTSSASAVILRPPPMPSQRQLAEASSLRKLQLQGGEQSASVANIDICKMMKNKLYKVPLKRSANATATIQMSSPALEPPREVKTKGYRIDDVKSSKIMEVEEFQEFQYVPITQGPAQITGVKEIGLVNKTISRTIGKEIYKWNDERLKDIELDEGYY